MKLFSAQHTAKTLGVTPQRLRQPDMERRLEPIRVVGGPRVFREDAVAAELDRRVDRALAKKAGAK